MTTEPLELADIDTFFLHLFFLSRTTEHKHKYTPFVSSAPRHSSLHPTGDSQLHIEHQPVHMPAHPRRADRCVATREVHPRSACALQRVAGEEGDVGAAGVVSICRGAV